MLGDPRNDVHVLVSQLHLAFLRLHNLFVTRLREDGVSEVEFGEVLIGIVKADPESFLAVDPAWTPTLADGAGRTFGIGELLRAVAGR